MSAAPASGNGSADRPPGDPLEPGRPHSGRGLAIVIVAVVIGVLLLPSATRAPLSASAVSAGSSTTTVPPGRAPSGHGTSTTTTTTVPPASIHVLVANATEVNGVAGAVTTFLASKGFGTLTATNALLKVTASEVFTVGGATADVAPVVAALGLPASCGRTGGLGRPGGQYGRSQRGRHRRSRSGHPLHPRRHHHHPSGLTAAGGPHRMSVADDTSRRSVRWPPFSSTRRPRPC